MPEPTRVIGLGAGGHAAVVVEILRAQGGFELVGLLDPRPELRATEVCGVPVLGGDELLEAHYDAGVRHVFVGLGSAQDTRPRRALHERARGLGFEVVSALHPAAVVSPSASVGPGATLMAGAVVNARASLGEDVIVNSGAVVEHDCAIGDHVHVATGARLASGVRVEEGAHVGLGALVNQGLTIGAGSVVGSGAVVVRDVEPGVVVVGAPARTLRKVEG